MHAKINYLVNSLAFALWINLIIVINATLIGIETYYTSTLIIYTQRVILGIFTLEIALRFIGRTSTKDYFSDGWNLFDIVIVSVSYIPDSLFENSAALSVFRIMRVFRVLRLVKTLPELKVIVSVLLKSLKSLGYTFILLFIFMYMYAIMGVILFKGGPVAANGPAIGPTSPDPYGTITESFFTLFRIMTGEDWTDLRYNLLGGQVVGATDWLITAYHVSWLGLSAFLLINLVVGAVVNNYDQVMEEYHADENAAQESARAHEISELHRKMDDLSGQVSQLIAKVDQKQERAPG